MFDQEVHDTETASSSVSPPQKVVFTPRRLRTQVRMDLALRTLLLAGVAITALAILTVEQLDQAWTIGAVIVVLIVWVAVNAISARVSRELPMVTALLDADHAAAEDRIARLLRRWPLMRWVRLMLYHRLAVLRHRTGQFADSAQIAEAVLNYRLGPAAQARPHLLLMLAEARMQLDQPAAAYAPLAELHTLQLNLAENLQRLALQTRYEVMINRHDAAIHNASHKIELAELMPAVQCGAMHALLATAAHATRQTELARWLWARAELLLTPPQLQHLASGGFGVVVAAPPDAAPAPIS